MDVTRRDFVKASAIAAAMAAAGGSLAACASKPDAGQQGAGDAQTHTAVCRFCGCGCGVLVETKDGKITAVTGDPDNQSNRGLNCVKGYYLGKILYGRDRLTTPLIRDDAGTKGTESGLREASWEEALELVSTKLRETWKKDKKDETEKS